jgi:hypothetical protein
MTAVPPVDEESQGADGTTPSAGHIDFRVPPSLQESIARSVLFPKLKIDSLLAPTFELASSSIANLKLVDLDPIGVQIGKTFLDSILGDIGKTSLLEITPRLDGYLSGIFSPTLKFLKGLDLDLTRGPWPENLEHLDWDLEILNRLMVDEGLPIAWIPRAQTMRLIFDAETPAQRRAIYGRRWRGIIDDCEEIADMMDSTWLAPYMRYLREVVRAMRSGHYLAAQALAASTLDTVAFYLANSVLRDARRPEKITDPGKLPLLTYFAWSQLAGIYKRYFRENDDPIPATFNRHGASHGVSSRQYSRLNATLGMAHLTSLMWIIDSETRHLKKRAGKTSL